jgi:hypothetical protein
MSKDSHPLRGLFVCFVAAAAAASRGAQSVIGIITSEGAVGC